MPNPPSPLSISTNSPSTQVPVTAVRVDNWHRDTNGANQPKQQPTPETAEKATGKKSNNSPSSPRNFKGLFSGKSDKYENNSNSRHGGATGSVSTSDLNRTVPIVRPYPVGSNDSTPSLSQGKPLDETASTKSAASGVPESVRSDDDHARIKSNSSSNVIDQSAYRKDNKGGSSSNLGRKGSLRQNQNLRPTFNRRFREDSDPKTAPLRAERGFQEALSAQQLRNRSADRSAIDSEDESTALPSAHKSSSFNSQTSFLSNVKQHGARAADGLGKAGKGFWGKFNRSGSSHEKETSPSAPHAGHGALHVIQLPLIEQTRKTRIKRTMDLARDKTEFWMPALPYRCIDYLNHYGVESEGLFRIPGSITEVKMLQAKFDSGPYYDLDLLEQAAQSGVLIDVNAVASLLKAWLRDMSTSLLPEDVQRRIQEEAPNQTETPQLMRDELSKLPPYNYYLLFAVTCHISLLHSHCAVNKMHYQSLQVCFAPCMKIDRYIFEFLVRDWRNCWQGCWTELDFLEEEQEILEGRKIPSSITSRTNQPSSQPNSRPTTSRSPERRAPAPPPPPPSASSEGQREVAQPFAQDLGGKMYSSRQQSPPPKLDPVPPITRM